LARRLILFDIDGTLIATNRAGRRVLGRALREVYGSHGSLDSTSFSGQTDLGIITAAMTAAGLTETAINTGLPRLYQAMARHGQSIFTGDNLVPCPGVLPLLAQLRANPDILLGLQTGNARVTALLKLRAAGLDPAWFPVGAFGSDAATRDGLFPVAWRRARELTGQSFSGHNTFAVGDTPGDILSAQANGVTSLAVASGFSHHQELAVCRPDHLVPDLADTRAILAMLAANHRPR
jgi:phosphoglycolate phosphatase-like HAD superfamily hydrolase